jgi:transketolase
MTGIAAGLALEGKKVVTYSIANFPTFRCLEQIRNDAAYHELNLTIIANGGGFSYGQLGMSHHATEDLSIMRSLPGVDVCAPCSEYEAGMIINEFIKKDRVSYLRLDRVGCIEIQGADSFVFGKMRKLKDGDDFTIISTGGIMSQALEAAEILNKSGIRLRVLSCHSIKPFDSDSVVRACKETGGIITIEEHNLIGGLASAVSECCLNENILPRNFYKLGLKDEYSAIVGDQQYLRDHYQINTKKIVEIVKAFNLK